MQTIVAGAFGALLLFNVTSANAQDSGRNASVASEESGEAVSALAESGMKIAVGVSVFPVGSVAVGASVAGSALIAAGDASAAIAAESTAFSSEPLRVDDEVIVAPQPAPNVPYRLAPTVKKSGQP